MLIGKKTISLINIVLVLLIIGLFLLLIREIAVFYTAPPKKITQNPAAQQRISQKKEFMEYSPILRKNPFGFDAGELSQLSSKTDIAPAIIDVKLIGTVSGNRKFAYAIFADKNNMQEIFKTGDAVFGLGRLQKVEKDRVILEDKGKTREIQIADIITVKETHISGAKPESVPSDRFARKTADTSYIIDGQRLQQALANPNQIMTDARLLPNVTDGAQEGFVLREVRSGGIYQSIGLQNGDVLLRINEYNISNPETALQAFTALKGMDRVQLDIIRSGSRMTMTYQIK
ncbi:MAG: hypothetical protein HY755_02795 [Nitrospirae bacterium]|nr:hypothetical protein [Nitrospirota bacterium]